MKLLTHVLWVLLFGAISTQAVLADDNQKIIDAIQNRYDASHTFKATFIQRSYLKVMDQTQQAKGEVFIKKPGKMKWTYSAPDPQVLVSDSNSLWLYLPEEEQVTKMLVENIYSTNTPALFLSGEGKLTEAFNVENVITENQKTIVELIPKKEEQNLSKLVLYTDKNNFQIIGSRVYDKLGNTTEMFFTDIEDNPAIADTMFQFEVPPGVELIDLSAPQ